MIKILILYISSFSFLLFETQIEPEGTVEKLEVINEELSWINRYILWCSKSVIINKGCIKEWISFSKGLQEVREGIKFSVID